MTPFQQEILRKRGDTEEIVMNIVVNKNTKDITGHSFKMTVAKQLSPTDSSSKIFDITARIVKANQGQIAFDITPEQANHVGQFYYDIEMTKPDGKIKTIVEGNFILTQDITK